MNNTRTRICPTCGKSFSYEIGPGKDRKHCTDTCRINYKKEKDKIRKSKLPKCKTDWCNNRATRIKVGLCEACYMRLYRKGTTDKKQAKGWFEAKDGYYVYYKPDHPLANKSGMIRAHRYIAYEKYGPGEHQCHYCGIKLSWDDITVDHFNNNKQDNDPDNLVVACNNCNRLKGSMSAFASKLTITGFNNLIKSLIEYRKIVGEGKPFGGYPGGR